MKSRNDFFRSFAGTNIANLFEAKSLMGQSAKDDEVNQITVTAKKQRIRKPKNNIAERTRVLPMRKCVKDLTGRRGETATND